MSTVPQPRFYVYALARPVKVKRREERERQSERMRGKLTSEGAEKISAANKRSWAENRQQRVERMREAQQRPEVKQRKSEASNRVGADLAYRAKRAEIMSQRYQNPAEREKVRQHNIDRYGYTYKLYAPDGAEFTTNNLQAFCEAHGLNASHMSKVARGILKAHKGWMVTREKA